jgi:2-C-methyl-D-erythritol 2,4-cyclodiphosphate synthase
VGRYWPTKLVLNIRWCISIFKIGIGYDTHRLVEGRALILGGVLVPFSKGLLGHSDADVLLHAIMDSILGALALGDIGKHFPDTDEEYKGASSINLLKSVAGQLKTRGCRVVNIDAVIIAQEPKLGPYMAQMKKNISEVLEIDEGCVNIKATTEEGLGFTGAGLGMSAQSVCLIQ